MANPAATPPSKLTAPEPNPSRLISSKRGRQDSPSRTTTNSSGSLSILDRLRRLENDYSAQTTRVTDLENTIIALRRDLYGTEEEHMEVDAGPSTVPTSGATVSSTRIPTTAPPEQQNDSSHVDSSSRKRRAQSAREQLEYIKQERSDHESEGEDSLYDAPPLPLPPPTPPQPTVSAPSAQAGSSASASSALPTPSTSVAIRMPHPVRTLPPIHHTLEFPADLETFSHHLILSVLGGQQICDGYYETSDAAKPRKYAALGWFALERDREPYAPPEPGHHGAKLSIFMQNTQGLAEFVDLKTHLFVRNKRGENYTYFGTYQEPRYSDRLDYTRMIDEVPEKVKKYWAQTLGAKKKPRWNVDVLIDHGLLNRDAVVVDGQVDWDMAVELADDINPSHIIDAFDRSDMDEEPNMRLYWEYLQCTGYDMRLYETLCRYKIKQERH